MTEAGGKLFNGRYRLIEPIGIGGMGKVWRGRDELLDRDVAVKEILFPHSMPLSERKVLGQRAMREARSAARLNHPGIVTVHDVITCDDAPIIVMEFIDGSSLAQVIEREERLAPAEVARIGAMMLEALGEAHAAGIVHRDLKPANVLLTGNRVIITDFGIASLAGDVALTASGVLIGTPAFMAPEQVDNLPVTAAGDLWSLGATLYAAVEGRPPYTGTNLMAVLAAMIAREPDPPVHAGSLAPILTGLLRKDPAERLDTEQASLALAAVTAAQDGQPPLHTAPSRPWAPPSASKASAWPASERPHDGQLGDLDTATRRHRFSPPEGPGQGRNGDAPASAQPAAARGIRSLSRRRVLLLAGLGAMAAAGVPAAVALTRGPESSLSRPGQWTLAATLTGHTWDVEAVAFSPDGTTLASSDREGTLRLWDVTARKPLVTLTGHTAGVHAVAFSPDGTTLASGGEDKVVRLWRTG
ncbi:serine/threonine protein kinase [Streptosporangium album]|uniref:non-specific serine/threonine protein kinase n=1 Tax=Streptosporangium album TaxID=47479 RepID=A0A7W7S590_9ACTN|nr:serine/threonine-protein kinase [Streptosporangium album]MBB4944118.1 serine/threonine protein kinase [Streptosporangium album]